MMAAMKAWFVRHRAASLGGLALIVVVAVMVLIVALSGDDDPKTAPTTTSSSTTSSTIPPSTTTTTVTPPTIAPFDTAAAVWPFTASSTRYTEPIAAVRGFAVDFVGFTAPVTSAFRPGEPGSGEVDVRPRADGPVTTVAVRRLGADNTWWVLGATTANIELGEPAALATISSPVSLRGRSTAFEGTVNTEIRRDGVVEPLTSGFVMGGATGALEPFTGTLTFARPTVASGAIVLHTVSAENGQVWEATVVRVNFVGEEPQ